jgi:hypothetical protein
MRMMSSVLLIVWALGCGRVDPGSLRSEPTPSGGRDASVGDGSRSDASLADGSTPTPMPPAARDLDNDGFSDLVLQVEQREVVIHHGGPAGVERLPREVILGGFNPPMSMAHDLNADGFTDLVVSGTHILFGGSDLDRFHVSLEYCCSLTTWRPPRSRFAAVLIGDGAYDFGFRVFRARAETVDTQPSDTVGGAVGQSGASFDELFATGDFDGDGDEEIAFGAFGEAGFIGKVRIYSGDPPSLSTTLERSGARNFGGVLAVGDYNGDGKSDLAVGGWRAMSSGAVIAIYHGAPSGLSTQPQRTFEIDNSGNFPAPSLAAIGDVNADGYGDLAIGTPISSSEGSALLYFGSSEGLGATADRELAREQNTFGFRVGGIGDVNGDGIADFVITGLGAAFVHFGNSAGSFERPSQTLVYQGAQLYPAR